MVRCECGGSLQAIMECERDIDPDTGRLTGVLRPPRDQWGNVHRIECKDCLRIYTRPDIQALLKKGAEKRG